MKVVKIIKTFENNEDITFIEIKEDICLDISLFLEIDEVKNVNNSFKKNNQIYLLKNT